MLQPKATDFSRVLALLAAFAASSLHALGLGEIEVRSRLNQPMDALIPVTSASVQDLESLSVGLASSEDFERAGLDRADFLATFDFTLKGDAIRITGKDSVREPFVSFLVEARWSGGRLLREYTVLLDPPGLPRPSSPSSTSGNAEPVPEPVAEALIQPVTPAAPPAVSEPVAESLAAEPEPVEVPKPAPAPAQSTVAASPAAVPAARTYGPVKPQETLWSIALRLRPDKALTMDQVQLALFEANPAAFDGSIKGLRSGSVLSIPSAEQIAATDAATATRKVRGTASRPPSSPITRATPAPKPAPVPETVVQPPPVASAPPPVAPAVATVEPEVLEVKPEPVAEAAAVAPAPPAPAPEGDAALYDEDRTIAPPATSTGTDPQADAVATTPLPEPAVAPEPVVADSDDAGSGLDWTLPAAGGVLVLGLAFAALRLRRKRAQAEPVASAPRMASPSAVAAAVAGDADADAPTVVAAATPKRKIEPKAVDVEVTRVIEKPLAATAAVEKPMAATQTLATPVSSTVALEPAQAKSLSQTIAAELPLARSTGVPAKVDFDVTSQFEQNTVQINLDANDPLAEADFHLAYGLYEEAALLLQQAAAKDPGRIELRAKLVEVFFAANRADDFRRTAQELKGKVGEAEWQKIAIMGQQLCPDAEVFKDVGGDIGASVDLAFDETPATPEPAPAAPAPDAGNTMEFKLDELALPEPPAEPAKPAMTENTVQFDISDIKLEPLPELAEPKIDETLLEMPTAEPQVVSGDEIATKLDLARAYIDMGDKDMAKGLLDEVLGQGNDSQKGEARELLGRLSA